MCFIVHMGSFSRFTICVTVLSLSSNGAKTFISTPKAQELQVVTVSELFSLSALCEGLLSALMARIY